MKLRSKEVKTPIQKPLCRLCECPTSDGHVLASQVDRIKLRKWAMKVMNLTEGDENLPEVVEEDALICYFCIWQAEFGDESGDEAVAWWPKNLDLEENAKVLRENYSVGEVEQCWVQLEEVDLTKYEKEIPKKSKFDIDLAEYEKDIPTNRKYGSGMCFYCGKRFNDLRQHIKLMHKEAIKCGIRSCGTYFHTEEEKEQHMQQVSHEKRNKQNTKIRCKYCEIGKLHSSVRSWRQHMKHLHPELPEACARKGCNEYFKSKSEKIQHVNSKHKRGISQDVYQCKHCDYFTTMKHLLKQHKESTHMPKIFKCDSCDAKFGSKVLVSQHHKRHHTFENCKSCGQNLTNDRMKNHRKPSFCSRCKVSFKCSGLYQLHRESCKKTVKLFSCKECEKSFNTYRKLYHHRKVHTKRIAVRCQHCDFSTFHKEYMVQHMQGKHLPKTIKCNECNILFASERILKLHKNGSHRFLRCSECAQEIGRQKLYSHQQAKTCHRCECKFKCRGLLENHFKSCLQIISNDFFCDMCPRFYRTKAILYHHIVKKHIGV
ncbi:oocyte zinc finger protein XlCOF7.1-like [Cloeon dipterum]|uniref:oocyte zinc finger protein XlCOF7.1-like n=1 Tax=Cloeon dipterum TaxID=197152 RepID=UPI0032206485